MIQLTTCISKVDSFADLLEKGQLYAVLELLDLHRHCWLGEVKFFGRTREAQVAGNRLKHFQLPQGNVQHGAWEN
jgi:hypothetical protein